MPGTILVYDTFTDNDNTGLDAHTIAPTNLVGASWTEYDDGMMILSNVATAQNYTASGAKALLNCGYSDCIISTVLVPWGSSGNNRKNAIVIRGGAYYVLLNEDSNKIVIADSSFGELASSAFTCSIQPYTVTVKLLGQTISATVDGVNVLYSSATINETNTTHGIYAYYSTDSYYLDNFIVMTIPDNWWLSGGIPAANCIAAYQGISVADKATSLINLANPGTYNLTETGTVNWSSANGWDNGSSNSNYLTSTGWGTLYANNVTIITRYSWVSGNLAAIYGDTLQELLLYVVGDSDMRVYWGGTGYQYPGGSGYEGDVVIGMTNTNFYVNGLFRDTITAGGTGITKVTITDKALSGSGEVLYSKSLAIYNTNLTAAQVAAVTTAMNVL